MIFFFHLFDSSFSKFYRFLLQRIQYNFSFDENSFCGISDCSFCCKFWELHLQCHVAVFTLYTTHSFAISQFTPRTLTFLAVLN